MKGPTPGGALTAHPSGRYGAEGCASRSSGRSLVARGRVDGLPCWGHEFGDR